MNKDFKTFLHIAKQTKLPEEKKDFIRMRLQDFMEMTPIRTARPSPLTIPRYISKFTVLHFGKAVSFALIVLIASGGTISYASEDTLPGDVFYTVKVNVKEPIQEKLAFTSEARLVVQTKQVEKRLNEAQTLLKNGDTSPEKHREVEVRVEQKVSQMSTTIDKLQEEGNLETILDTTSKLEPVLKAHQQALQESVVETSLIMVQETPTEDNDSSTLSSAEFIDGRNPIEVSENTDLVAYSTQIAETTPTMQITNNLLNTIERTLEKVTEQETKALESMEQLEVSETNTKRITDATDKKVGEVEKEIEDIKNSLKKTEIIPIIEVAPVSDSSLETILETNITNLTATIEYDNTILLITESELLLAESKKLFEQGLHKESFAKAQEALKIIALVEANQKIQKVQTAPIEQTPQTETQVQDITPPTELELIEIENQASQAIQALEGKLEVL